MYDEVCFMLWKQKQLIVMDILNIIAMKDLRLNSRLKLSFTSYINAFNDSS